MRILIVTTDFIPNLSGIATLSYEQAKGLQKLNHVVKIITTTRGAAHSSMEADFEVQEFINKQPPIIRLVGLFQTLHRVIADWRPDFLWCTNYRGFGLPVMALARRHYIPYGLYLHGTELITENRNVLRRVIFKTVTKRAALRCTNSKNTAALLQKLYSMQAIAITPGVNQPDQECADLPTRSNAFRQSWLSKIPSGICDSERIVFIAICRMSRQKGIHIVLESIATLEPAIRDKLIFVAVGSGESISEFQKLTEQLDLGQKVIFAGPARRNEVPAMLKAADVYLQPSQPEGDFLESFGISFLEAQAAGLPCIGTNWGGVSEAVKGPDTALLVPPRSVEAVAEAIARAISDTAWRTAAGIAGPAWASKNSWQNHAKTLESMLPR